MKDGFLRIFENWLHENFYTLYKTFSTAKTAPIVYDTLVGNLGTEAVMQGLKTGAVTVAKSSSLMSSTVGLSTLTTGLSSAATSTALTTGLASLAATSSIATVATVAAPAVAIVAVGYCLKEIFDW